jgi:Ca-activated chloride channel homolog
MFEAQFDKSVEIPASAMQAKNTPADAPAAESRVAEASPNEVKPGTPPVLIDVRGRQSSEESAAPHPEVATAGSPAVATAKAGAESLPSIPAIATISVKVRMVQVDAVVRDRAGRMIDNLKVDDFRIYEDGVPQEIQGFSRDELPLAVALVIDRSGSVAPYISELRRIAGKALDQLKPQDEVCLFSFADTVQRVEDLTADRRRITSALDRIRAGGATDITDALHDSINYLARTAPGRRHAIILISDNKQTVNPQAGEGETMKLAMESETVVYSLRTAGDSMPLGTQIPSILFSGRGPVGKITQETGGEVIDVRNSSALDSALGSVISRLRMRYSLSYYPTSASQGGAFHAITVRLTDSKGKPGSDYYMHAKRGYYATGSSSTTTSAYPASKQFL